jgi:peptidyl-prolyl cis-trans isomerase B (cyclophilin B)
MALSPLRASLLLLLLGPVLPACGGDKTAKGGCTDAETHTHQRTLSNEHLKLDTSKTYDLKVETNCGDFTITLDPAQSPNATGSLVSLAKRGYFDDTFFHRIAPGFVIQGGDPTGTGGGGPGYETHDHVKPDASYVHGTVAMAKTAAEAQGTAGSQFFVVTANDAQLPPDYAVVGTVTDGIDVVDRIGKLGNGQQQPTRPVVISKVEVEES